jgi:hypothetical protein
MSGSLWASADAARWAARLESFWAVAAAPAVGGKKSRGGGVLLLELERWYQQELPARLAAPPPPGRAELERLMEWKLTRGTWRPRLLDFVKALAEEDARAAWAAALAALPRDGGDCPPAALRAAIAAIAALKGLGPATASAALSAADASVPFMSDEALTAALGKKEYTVGAAVSLATALQGKARALSEAGGRRWTAREVERTLYAEAKAGAAATAPGGDKRKRKR